MAPKNKTTIDTTAEAAPATSAVAPVETTALSAPVVSTTALASQSSTAEFDEDAETMKKDDLVLSRYRCVQALSRAKKQNKELREGMFYNTLTGKGMERALVVPIYEEHIISEQVNDSSSKFIRVLQIEPVMDPRVKKALKANNGSYVKLLSADEQTDPPTKFVETRNIHVVFLDEKDGVTALGFAVLSFHSTNLMPCKIWKNDRTACKNPVTKKAYASYFYRTIVTCETKDNSRSNQADSMIFKLEPYKGNWRECLLSTDNPDELALLRNCAAHKKLLESGVFTVDYTDAGEDEGSEEDASFDPEDLEKPAQTQPSGSKAAAVNPDDF